MIQGISVLLHKKEKNGIDEFGHPTYTEKLTVVPNVLVSPTSSQDKVDMLNLYGKTAAYILAIPKRDKNDWTDVEVEFLGKTWRTIGIPQEGIADMIPGDWNRKVMVEYVQD